MTIGLIWNSYFLAGLQFLLGNFECIPFLSCLPGIPVSLNRLRKRIEIVLKEYLMTNNIFPVAINLGF